MAQLSHSFNVFSDGSIEKVQQNVQLYRVKHDFEIGHERQCVIDFGGCPEVWFLRENQYNWLTKEWQEFWFWLNKGDRTVEGDLKAWSAYTNGHAFITDQKGTDEYHDYITNDNEGKPYPDTDPKIKRLVCGGNVITGEEFLYNGEWHLKPKFLDATSLPDYDIFSKPNWQCYIHHATNLTITNKVNPFAYIDTKYLGRVNNSYILYPFVGRGDDARIPLRQLEKLPLGSPIPNPYVPPMPFEVVR